MYILCEGTALYDLYISPCRDSSGGGGCPGKAEPHTSRIHDTTVAEAYIMAV